jgi:hypothetical protein
VNQREKPHSPEVDFLIPTSLITFGVRLALRVSLWVVRRPFLMPRRRWLLLFVTALLFDLLAWLLGQPLIGLALVVVLLAVGTVLAHWWWLGRGREPIIFISLFEGRSAPGRNAARTHIGALARFLIEDENLARIGPFAIRPILIPLWVRPASARSAFTTLPRKTSEESDPSTRGDIAPTISARRDCRARPARPAPPGRQLSARPAPARSEPTAPSPSRSTRGRAPPASAGRDRRTCPPRSPR